MHELSCNHEGVNIVLNKITFSSATGKNQTYRITVLASWEHCQFDEIYS